MNEDKLKLITITKRIINKIYKSILNCPNEHMDLRIILNELCIYLKQIYIANDISNINKKKELKEEILYKTKYISSLINMLYENKLINNNIYLEIGSEIELLIKLLKGWIKI